MVSPWYARPAPVAQQERSAIVVGGGIAGAATAHSLAIRGWQVTLIERLPALAQAASGNPQGVLYTKLSPHFTRLPVWYWLAMPIPCAACTSICRRAKTAGKPAACCNWRMTARSGTPDPAGRSGPACLTVALGEQGRSQPDSRTSVAIRRAVFPARWLAGLVQALCAHPNIQLRTSHTVIELDYNPVEQSWLASSEQGPLAMGSAVVLCTAADTAAFDSTSHLPLKAIRGQVSTLPVTAESAALQTVLCGEGYVSPARHQQHCVGATFKFDADNLDVTADEHEENLDMLAGLAPALHQALQADTLSAEKLGGRAAYRCTSPDYLPIIGPVVNRQDFANCYSALANDATLPLTQAAPYIPGLYVNAAHGSRGMITAPLSGEIIAAYLEDEAAPLPVDLMQAVHPSRFLLRRLIRKQG
jgi:tRNA 5-methylaminomethyl-2-thiouridine biosynthesis bifunctional protein